MQDAKTYKVVSNAPQFGHKKGDTFTRALSEAQEARMVRRGAIEVVETTTKTEDKPGAEPAKKPGVTPGGKR
jgi:hypothetical protein